MPIAPEKQAQNRNGHANGRLANGQFAPGVSGNPAGRPKKEQSLADLIRAQLDEVLPDGRSKKEALAQTMVDKAIEGDFRFVRILAEKLLPDPIEDSRRLPDYMEDWEPPDWLKDEIGWDSLLGGGSSDGHNLRPSRGLPGMDWLERRRRAAQASDPGSGEDEEES